MSARTASAKAAPCSGGVTATGMLEESPAAAPTPRCRPRVTAYELATHDREHVGGDPRMKLPGPFERRYHLLFEKVAHGVQELPGVWSILHG